MSPIKFDFLYQIAYGHGKEQSPRGVSRTFPPPHPHAQFGSEGKSVAILTLITLLCRVSPSDMRHYQTRVVRDILVRLRRTERSAARYSDGKSVASAISAKIAFNRLLGWFSWSGSARSTLPGGVLYKLGELDGETERTEASRNHFSAKRAHRRE